MPQSHFSQFPKRKRPTSSTLKKKLCFSYLQHYKIGLKKGRAHPSKSYSTISNSCIRLNLQNHSFKYFTPRKSNHVHPKRQSRRVRESPVASTQRSSDHTYVDTILNWKTKERAKRKRSTNLGLPSHSEMMV